MEKRTGIFQFTYNIKKFEAERIEQRLRIKVETSTTRAKISLYAQCILHPYKGVSNKVSFIFGMGRALFSASDKWVE